jgi:cystathionine beta-lyase
MIASLSPEIADITATATSASKTFNLAGLQDANILIENEKLRAAYRKAVWTTGFHDPSLTSIAATTAAYNTGDEWLDELLVYLKGNIDATGDFLENNMEGVHATACEGTYLVWVDFRERAYTNEQLEKLIEDANLWLDAGTIFGEEGSGYQRFNVATSRSYLTEALESLARASQGR